MKPRQDIKHPFILSVYLITLVVVIIGAVSCVEEYWPKMNENYDRVLVVDGMITNEPGPYWIKLSLSTSPEKPNFTPLPGYTVMILDDQGEEEELIDMSDGRYKTRANGIEGIPGRSYKTRIISPEGAVYESSFELLHGPVGIDSVWAEYETREDLNYDHLLEGYRFRITTEPSLEDTTYFLWRLEGTYEYQANHYIKYYFDGEMKPFPKYDSLYTCWRTYRVNGIFTHHTMNLSEPFLRSYPLHYVNTQDKKLSVRYSLLTSQYVITQQAHEYWKNLQEQSNEMGSLYTTIPFQVRGNTYNIADPDELVLGYFMAASVAYDRTFVDKPWYAKFYYETECDYYKGDISHQLYLLRDHWPVYLFATYSEYGQSPALPVKQDCVNCEESGGTIHQPAFWITD